MIFACVKKYTDRARAGQPMWGAIYPAIQNLCLAARGYGLGTSITGMHTMFAKEIDAMLGVPPEYANVILIPMGYPKGRWARPDRKPALQVTFWEKWGNSPRQRPRLTHASITASHGIALNLIARLHPKLDDAPAGRRLDRDLDLHRLDHHQLVAARDLRTARDRESQHLAHRRTLYIHRIAS